MRILHIYHDFWPRGGIEDVLRTLVFSQADNGHEVMVLTAHDSPATRDEVIKGVRIIYAASVGRVYMPFCPSWPLWIQKLKPEIVHLHLPCPFGEWAVAVTAGYKLVVSLHNEYVRPRWALPFHLPLHRHLLRRANAICVSSQDYAETSLFLQNVAAKVHIVPYGIDLTRYFPSPDAKPSSNVLWAGRFTYYKGLDVLMAAAPMIHAPVDLVGQGKSRPQAASSNVCFRGSISEEALIQKMQTSRVFVFPSTERAEAFGLSQLKAMACGLPVVSSNLAGVRWVNRAGLQVPVRDAAALAHAVNRLLHDDTLHQRISSESIQWAQQFTLDRMVQKIDEVYTWGLKIS